MIQRRKGYGKREPSHDAHKIYIVCVENVEIMTNVFLSQKWGTFWKKGRYVFFVCFSSTNVFIPFTMPYVGGKISENCILLLKMCNFGIILFIFLIILYFCTK